MSRGRASKGRSRARRPQLGLLSPRVLLETEDYGRPVHVEAKHVGASGERWLEPFLEANRSSFSRLGITPSIDTTHGLRIRLTPGNRLGAVPLLSPATRRVAAGLLIRPRFRWHALGAVMSAVGFETEPNLGQAPLVPGSAREVPPWLIAGPVLRRIEGLLAHRRRQFVEHEEVRSSPRGQVQWTRWATRDVPNGRWTKLPCRFPQPEDDPRLLANVRWTLTRLAQTLSPHRTSLGGRALHERVRVLQTAVGPGRSERPEPWEQVAPTAWVADALEAMHWVREERGLGGSRNLDGLAWDLPVDELWEVWVRAFAADLAPRLGLCPVTREQTRRGLSWSGRVSSMGSLVPDCILRGRSRAIVIDAKYKRHLDQLSRKGWSGLSSDERDAHRADLHQALAYANLLETPLVDTVLAFPTNRAHPEPALCHLHSGRSRLRLHLLPLPFGLPDMASHGASLEMWAEALRV